MSKKFYVLIFLLLIAAGFTVKAIANRAINNTTTNETKQSGLQRWEYCIISYTSGEEYDSFSGRYRKSLIHIYYYTSSGLKEELVEGANAADVRAKSIAKLGNEGWEMVQEGAFTSHENISDAIYFKRPKQ